MELSFRKKDFAIDSVRKLLVKSQPMDTWAVIKSGGKQYKVKEGDKIVVEKVTSAKDSQVTFEQILLVATGSKLTLGKPLVSQVKVKGKILENFKDKKVRVVKFKSKSKYLRVRGHRQQKSKILIEKIQL